MNNKPEIKVGQTVYVESIGWINKEPRELTPFEVTKINTKSIYAKSKKNDYEIRFDKKTMSAKGALSTDYIWLDQNAYWDNVRAKEKKENLRKKISQELPNLRLDELEAVAKLLKIEEEC